MRVLLGAYTDHPVAWIISKVENAAPLGLQKLTLYQDMYDTKRDYIEKNETGKITGMYADWYDSQIEPIEQPRVDIPAVKTYAKISTASTKLKVGSSSYKTLTLNVFDDSNEDISTKYSSATFTWGCSIGEEDFTDKVTWLDNTSAYNQIKVKFPADKSYLTKLLTVKCKVEKDGEVIETSTELELY